MNRRRWSFDAANAELARKLAAARSPAELVDDLARLADRPKGVSVLGNRPRALARLTRDGVAVLAERVRDASRPSRTAE